MWIANNDILSTFVAKLFGLKKISKKSLQIGGVMMLTIGYVLFYSIFKAKELWIIEEK
jgi:hypothetical protein